MCTPRPPSVEHRTAIAWDHITLALVRFALYNRYTFVEMEHLDFIASRQLDKSDHQPLGPVQIAIKNKGCHALREPVPCTDSAIAAEPTRTRRRLLDLYHGSKAAPLCQQDTFTQGGQVRQAGARDPIGHLVILFQAPVSF